MTAEPLIFRQIDSHGVSFKAEDGVLYADTDETTANDEEVDATFVVEMGDDEEPLSVLANSSFAEDWESDADSIYDSLLEDAHLQ